MKERRGDTAHRDPFSSPALESRQQAAGAQVVGVVAVPPLVEHAADLVHPALAMVTLHPVLVDLLLVLLLLEAGLLVGPTVGQGDGVAQLVVRKAGVAEEHLNGSH